ncbi:pre-mRNA splicing factor prp17 [Culex quinquefasciatus]|uniref:Pre-mRNA splicing factor prp17 n=1 Tax=Culex quinquefasciatus TaxID=7176 RepID=B0X4R3_CULQU|nr:pre-mRNA splicing factor prp17 [Culex quinquefasciatus]|eukprot:XP_001864635.1 pre-mRNA splicing factor prp17 [Culex quinquefasciatus]
MMATKQRRNRMTEDKPNEYMLHNKDLETILCDRFCIAARCRSQSGPMWCPEQCFLLVAGTSDVRLDLWWGTCSSDFVQEYERHLGALLTTSDDGMAWRRQSLHLFHEKYEQLSAYVSWSESTWRFYWFNSGSLADQQYRRVLILEFLLLLADTNSFVEGGPLLNLDREDSIAYAGGVLQGRATPS